MVLQWRMRESGVTASKHTEGALAKLRKLERGKKRKKGSGSDVPICLSPFAFDHYPTLCEKGDGWRLARPGSTMHSYAPLGSVRYMEAGLEVLSV